MLDCLDDTAVRGWCAGGLAALRRHQEEIDRLNVYPLPDRDTGTNLVLTLASAQQALDADLDNPPDKPETGHGRALRSMARGALLGARGNSGVILSQLLRGLADTLADVPVVRGRALAEAWTAAAAAAYRAVAAPVEGTVLTVAAAAATAAGAADSDELAVVVRAAAQAAAEALAGTPEQLPALAAAGVVDAGGRGLVVLLDALVAVVREAAGGTGGPGEAGLPPAGPAPVAAGPPGPAVRETGSPEYGYEVQYLLDASPVAVQRLRGALAALGDSLVVVGAGPDDGHAGAAGQRQTWHVHVHVNDVDAAIEAGVRAGRPHRITVTRFADQIAATGPRVDPAPPRVGPAPPRVSPAPPRVSPAPPADLAKPADPARRGTVVVAAGDGLARLFAAEGATVVGANPSTGQLLAAVRGTGAGRVVVLPGDPDTQAVAAAVVRQASTEGVRVSVLPTCSPVQALAALAVHDPRRRFSEDVTAMAEAAGACRYAAVCRAGREALTAAGQCRAGDMLALVAGEVHLIGTDLVETCRQLLDRLLGNGGELITLLVGADAPGELPDALRAHLSRTWPTVQVQVYHGGQPHYPLVVGVE